MEKCEKVFMMGYMADISLHPVSGQDCIHISNKLSQSPLELHLRPPYTYKNTSDFGLRCTQIQHWAPSMKATIDYGRIDRAVVLCHLLLILHSRLSV